MKKAIKLFIMITFVMILLTTIVFASSFDLKITLSDVASANIQQGQTLTFILKLTNIDAGDGIGAISGKFEYDTNVFEEVKAEDISAGNGWGSISYNDQNDRSGEFVTERAAGDLVSETNDLMSIKVKVKENAKLGKTEIKVSNISASNGNEDIEISDVRAELTIVDAQGNSVDNNTISNNTISNNTTNKNNTTNNTTSNTINNTANNVQKNGSANTDIPKTGIEDYFMPSIIVLATIAFISYVQYKRVKSI